MPTESNFKEVLKLIQSDLQFKKITQPLIITSAEDEVKLDESIQFDLRENRVVGFAVDKFSKDI